jgi:hypothetical protein
MDLRGWLQIRSYRDLYSQMKYYGATAYVGSPNNY